MRLPVQRLAVAVAAAFAVGACGGDEPSTKPAPRPAAPAAAVPTPVPVGCIAEWADGPTGKFVCVAYGPRKDAVQLTNDTVRLAQICLNDPRLTTYGFGGGQTAPIGAKGTLPRLCGDQGGVKRLPETCTCVPPAGGNCTPPEGGKFLCIATGHVGAG